MLESAATALGGVTAGYALAAAHLWRTNQLLRAARNAAAHDSLTGLPNRRALHARLGRALLRDRPVAVVLLDLDQFKTVNDDLGHAAGDEVLRQVANRLTDLPTPVDMVARLGGDEFVILTRDSQHAIAVATAAWQAITAAPIRIGEQHLDISASIGVASHRLGVDASQLLHHADLAMYQAKTSGHAVRAYLPGTADTPVPARPGWRRRDQRTH